MSEIDIRYLLKNVEILSLSIAPKPQRFNDTEFSFNITAEVRVAPENKILFLLTTIETWDVAKTEKLAELATALAFEIENFEEAIKMNEDNLFNVPIHLEITLRTISISTTRGIMFSHFKGTHLQKALLPIIPQMVEPEPVDKAT